MLGIARGVAWLVVLRLRCRWLVWINRGDLVVGRPGGALIGIASFRFHCSQLTAGHLQDYQLDNQLDNLPLSRNLRHIPRRNPPVQQGVHGRVQGTDRVPSRQRHAIQRARDQLLIKAVIRAYLPVCLQTNVAVQRVDDLRGQTADVRRRHMGAFCDLERVKRDQINGADIASFEGRQDMRVWFCGEGGEG